MSIQGNSLIMVVHGLSIIYFFENELLQRVTIANNLQVFIFSLCFSGFIHIMYLFLSLLAL